jgi:methionine--tRNA ligase beta chain
LFEKIEFKPLDEFSRVDLRVAQITAVDDVEGSDNLYKLQVDLGLFGKRQLIAGVKKFYTKEQLFNKKIILAANLKPAKIRGIESNGMLLAVEDEKHRVEVLTAEKSKPGDSVSAGDIEKKPAKEIDLDFFSSFDLKAKDGFVFYEDKKLKSDAEQIKSNVEGKVR